MRDKEMKTIFVIRCTKSNELTRKYGKYDGSTTYSAIHVELPFDVDFSFSCIVAYFLRAETSRCVHVKNIIGIGVSGERVRAIF